MSRILPFIEDEKLLPLFEKFLAEFQKIQDKAEKEIDKNALDPFSAVLFSLASDTDLETWLAGELNRQIGKSFQNKVGELHQNILGSCDGWEIVDKGIDIRNTSMKIIAEVKNKHNTTKGEDEVSIYNKLAMFLAKPEYKGYKAYFVQIIPKNKAVYNKPFTPSDSKEENKDLKRKPSRDDILVVDGKTFYEIATGRKDSLKGLYDAIPYIVEKIKGNGTEMGQDPHFAELFERTFS